MEDKEFYDKVDHMFESKLKRYKIRIKDIENDKILTHEDMDYNLVLFDANMNIYKYINGVLSPVDNPNFKAVLI